MKLVRAFDDYWFAPAPAERLALLRVLVGTFAFVYLLARCFITVAHLDPHEFAPIGVVHLLSAPLPGPVVTALGLLGVVLAVPFTLGMRYRVVGPLFALLFLWITSYRNSWGMVFHTENLLALHLILLAFAPAADTLSLDAVGRAPVEPAGAYGWPGRAMAVVTVLTYMLAGLAKLKLAGPEWLGGDLLRAQIAYDNLRKIELGSPYSVLGAALVHYRAPLIVLSWATVALELGAPLALFGRRTAMLWTLAAWGFHLGVVALMAIPFFYQLSLVAYAPFFELERLAAFARRRALPLFARKK